MALRVPSGGKGLLAAPVIDTIEGLGWLTMFYWVRRTTATATPAVHLSQGLGTNVRAVLNTTTAGVVQCGTFAGGIGNGTSVPQDVWTGIGARFRIDSTNSPKPWAGYVFSTAAGTVGSWPAGPSITHVGLGQAYNSGGTAGLQSDYAHVAIWGARLGDDEARMLSQGSNPCDIRPEALLHYWPLDFDGRNLVNRGAPAYHQTGATPEWINGPIIAPARPRRSYSAYLSSGPTYAEITGTIAASSGLSGTLSGMADLSGDIDAVSDITAELTGYADITSTLAKYLETAEGFSLEMISGDYLQMIEAQTGVEFSNAISGLFGVLEGSAYLEGTFAAVSTLTGTLTAVADLSGTIEAVSDIEGTLTGTGALAGTIAAVSTLSGTPSGYGALAGTIAAVATLTGVLTQTGDVINVQPIVARFNMTGVLTARAEIRNTGLISAFSGLSGVISFRTAIAESARIAVEVRRAYNLRVLVRSAVYDNTTRSIAMPDFLIGTTVQLVLDARTADGAPVSGMLLRVCMRLPNGDEEEVAVESTLQLGRQIAQYTPTRIGRYYWRAWNPDVPRAPIEGMFTITPSRLRAPY